MQEKKCAGRSVHLPAASLPWLQHTAQPETCSHITSLYVCIVLRYFIIHAVLCNCVHNQNLELPCHHRAPSCCSFIDAYAFLPLTQPLATTNLHECYINGIKEYMAFWKWLFPLLTCPEVHAGCCTVDSLYLFFSEEYWQCDCTMICFTTHLLTFGLNYSFFFFF